MSKLVVFFFLLLWLFPFHGSSQTPDEEQTILLDLKRRWQNPPSLAHWASSGASHCSWPEIQCTNGSVTGIFLPNSSISGAIPPFVCDLKSLQTIDLHGNKIPGEFPTALYNCSKLQYLDLSTNYFVGPLPGDIDRLTAVRVLGLSNNNFSGNIPPTIGRLPQLRNLSLSGTLFNGTFPPEIGNLSNLEILEMADIGFAPTAIPPTFTQLRKLHYVFMARSNLIGEIPESIGDMAALQYLDLSENKLSGKIPSSLFLLKNLSFVYIYTNNLSGEIPRRIESSNLAELDLGKNNLSGPIPEEFGKLENLVYLSVFMNQLSGQIPESIGRLPKLTEIKFFTNNLSGPLPADFGRYSPLEAFQVSDNRLSGSLPESLCFAGKLVGVVAFNNNLTGELPSSLGNCSTLRVVMVDGNRLSGAIPAGLWAASDLMTMIISDNLFTGKLPEKLARNLSRVEMRNNRFSGEIPARFPSQKNLVVFEASNNLFVGSLPRELTALPLLGSLLLDGNKLSGQLPSEIISWESLTTLNLSGNELTGAIPPEIGRLPHLSYVDLSQNRFTGEIPATLADQRFLLLNLSSNRLSGRIPKEFENSVYQYQTSFFNNPSLCSTNPSLSLKPCYYGRRTRNSHRPSSRFVALSFAIVAVVFTLAFAFTIFVIRALRRRKQGQDLKWKLTSFQRVSFTESDILSSLTENNVIGSGGSGKVYRAIVNRSGDQFVAVKKIWDNTKLDRTLEREFIAEIEILSSIRHSNIVKLLCCVHSDSSKLLVYEYLENRSLDTWLHGSGGAVTLLDWPKRLHIAVGAAQGLCYMHHYCSPPIIHRDVKSSNILLDFEFNAKIADFGLARMLKKQGEPNTMSSVQGSFGYMAPEYAHTVRVNEKIDVYSFGVVLLELATGREAGDGGEHGSLVEWAWCHIQRDSPISDALDKVIKQACYLDEMSSIFKLGIVCTKATPSARPSMSEVLQVLLRCSRPVDYKMSKARSEYEGAPLLKSATENNCDFISIV